MLKSVGGIAQAKNISREKEREGQSMFKIDGDMC